MNCNCRRGVTVSLEKKKKHTHFAEYVYRMDFIFAIAFYLSLLFGYFSICWSDTGSILGGFLSNLYYWIGFVVVLFGLIREFFRTPTFKIEPTRITSYDFFHREMCSVDLTKEVYYSYHCFDEYVEIKLSNQDFYDDKVKPRHYTLSYIRSYSEVYLPLVGDVVSEFPKRDWHFVPGGAVIVRHRDLRTSITTYKVLYVIVIVLMVLALAGAVYFFPLPYSKSTSDYEVESVSSTVLCDRTSPEVQFDTIYYDAEEEFVVAWSREFVVSKEHNTVMDVNEFFESKYPGITSFDFVATETYEDEANYYYVINILHLNNSVAGTKVSNTFFVYLPYYEGDTFLTDAANELKSSGSHHMSGKDLKQYHLHAPTNKEIFANTTVI